MRQQNRKGNFNKHTNNAYGYGNPNEYEHYKVEKTAPLLEWLMENVKGDRKSTRLNSSHSGGSRMPSSA